MYTKNLLTGTTTATTLLLAFSSLTQAAPATTLQARQDNTNSTTNPNADLIHALELASQVERYALLPNDSDFIYDFNTPSALASGIADRNVFPALTGLGGAFIMGDLPPCSMSFIHLHPRATEIFAVASGGPILTEMVPESSPNQKVYRSSLTKNMMTVFPQGAFHTQVNPTCDNATAIASFTSEDPGTSVIASGLFQFGDEELITTFGGKVDKEKLDEFREAVSPTMRLEVEACLKRCGGDGN